MHSHMRDPPAHFDLLTELDKETYNRLSAALSQPTTRNRKHKRVDDFQEIIDALFLYINHDEADKWKRSLVCGLFPFEGGIAVNISSLKKLIMKCKSSINGSFKAIGYPNVTTKSSYCDELLDGIPFLKNNFIELRQWSIRFKGDIPAVFTKDYREEHNDISPPDVQISSNNHQPISITVSETNGGNQNIATNNYNIKASLQRIDNDENEFFSWLSSDQYFDTESMFDFV